MKVDEYAEAVRDVERRIQKAEEQRDVELPAMEQPQGVPPVFEDHLALMLDLQLLAFQSDLTRVISFMIGKEQSARPYPQIGVPEAHHPLSHHNNDPELIAQMSKINRYHTQLFSQYLAKLRATPDGDGSLLDHMTILYGSGISNSTRHSGDNLPLLLVGGGAGTLKGGRHLTYTDKPSMANLLVTLMDKLDVPVEQLGGSTGKLPIDTLSGRVAHADRRTHAESTTVRVVRSCLRRVRVGAAVLHWPPRRPTCRSSTPPGTPTATARARAAPERRGRQRRRGGRHDGASLGELPRRSRERRPADSRRRQRQRGQRSRRHAALDGQPERQRGDGPPAAAGRARIRTRRSCSARRR